MDSQAYGDASSLLDRINAELREKYGFRQVWAVYETLERALSELHTYRAAAYHAEPFVVDVFADWNHLGVTLISCGDNNMGQWVDMVLQPDLKLEDFADTKK